MQPAKAIRLELAESRLSGVKRTRPVSRPLATFLVHYLESRYALVGWWAAQLSDVVDCIMFPILTKIESARGGQLPPAAFIQLPEPAG